MPKAEADLKSRNQALNEFLNACSDFRKTETYLEVIHFVGKFIGGLRKEQGSIYKLFLVKVEKNR